MSKNNRIEKCLKECQEKYILNQIKLELDLGDNQIGDEGAAKLSQSL